MSSAQDKLGLEAFVGRDVVLYLKPPYTCLMVTAREGAAAPAIVQDQNGQKMALKTEFITGRLWRRETGHYYIEYPDPAAPTNGCLIEAVIDPEFVFAVSAKSERPNIIKAPSGLLIV